MSPPDCPYPKGLIALLCLLAAVLGVSCAGTDDEEAVRLLVAKGAELAEAHDIGGIMELATRDLVAMPAELDRRAVKGVLWSAFNHYGALKVLYPRPEVEIAPGAEQASARFPFMIVKKEQSYPGLQDLVDDPVAWLEEAGENADIYRMTLQLNKQDGEWVVNLARLERFTGMGFEE